MKTQSRLRDDGAGSHAWLWTMGLLGLCLVGAPRVAQAQSTLPWNPKGLQVTRTELDSLLLRYRMAASSKTYSGALRKRAASEAELIQERLRDGDFRVGDRIALSVQGEPELDSMFTVSGDAVLRLPVIGDIPLKGVLRSELQPYLTKQIAKYIKNPQVTAQALIRVGVLGDVRAPGFYVVPSTAVLSDVLMRAGGPGPNADLMKVTVDRGGEPIWSGVALQTALAQSRTLDQLDLQAGDQVMVPVKSAFPLGTVLSVIGLLGTLTTLIFVRIMHR